MIKIYLYTLSPPSVALFPSPFPLFSVYTAFGGFFMMKVANLCVLSRAPLAPQHSHDPVIFSYLTYQIEYSQLPSPTFQGICISSIEHTSQ